jgi:hypothetical protein
MRLLCGRTEKRLTEPQGSGARRPPSMQIVRKLLKHTDCRPDALAALPTQGLRENRAGMHRGSPKRRPTMYMQCRRDQKVYRLFRNRKFAGTQRYMCQRCGLRSRENACGTTPAEGVCGAYTPAGTHADSRRATRPGDCMPPDAQSAVRCQCFN